MPIKSWYSIAIVFSIGVSSLSETAYSEVIFTTTFTVPATSNIFYAGQSSTPPDGVSGGIPATVNTNLTPNGTLKFTFSNVTGTIWADSTGRGTNGPDGGNFGGIGNPGTNITSFNGISGMVHTNKQLFLAGVFLANDLPAIAPPRLGFSDPEDFTSIRPAIGQTFFIGDGLTDTGITQEFLVPFGANRFYIGFLDAYDEATQLPFQGAPRAYNDNVGLISGTVTLSSVPEPASISLVAIGATVLVFRRFRRQKK